MHQEREGREKPSLQHYASAWKEVATFMKPERDLIKCHARGSISHDQCCRDTREVTAWDNVIQVAMALG